MEQRRSGSVMVYTIQAQYIYIRLQQPQQTLGPHQAQRQFAADFGYRYSKGMNMKKLLTFTIPIIGILLIATVAWASVSHNLFMPVVYDSRTPVPTATATRTPRPPTPTPTATPTYIPAEGGNTCAHIWAASKTSDGIKAVAQVPSVCAVLVVQDWQLDGQLVILRAERIKTDTWRCEQSDFGPIEWPPVDYPCPPPDDLDPFTWGDIQSVELDKTAKYVCGYCEECEYPHTVNCVIVAK
jgi:hypothetical protein